MTYRDLGSDHFDHSAKQKVTRRLVKRLAELGFDVEIEPHQAQLSAVSR